MEYKRVVFFIILAMAFGCAGREKVIFSAPIGMTSLGSPSSGNPKVPTTLTETRVEKVSIDDNGGQLHFGILLGQESGETMRVAQIFGIKYGRGWVKDINLEPVDWALDSVEIERGYIGDPQGDGVQDILLVVRIASTQPSTKFKQVRRAVIMYSLTPEDLRMALFVTLDLEGEAQYGDQRIRYRYEANPSWEKNEAGDVRTLNLQTTMSKKVCKRAGAGASRCATERTEDLSSFVWDPSRSIFTLPEKLGVQLIPDISIR
jgi:hypothetical protein